MVWIKTYEDIILQKGQIPYYNVWWKLNWKQWKWKKPHSSLTYSVLTLHWMSNVPGWHNKNYWTLKPVKLGGQDELQPIKWSQMIFSFHLFPNFSPLLHGPENTRLNKIYISTRKSSLSEGNFIPSWRNNIGNILLYTMYDSWVFFIMITTNISSNSIPHMVLTFLLVPLHLQEKFQERERRNWQIATNKLQSQNKT